MDATHNICVFPMGFFLESWKREKRIIFMLCHIDYNQ
jgi:hypothetical protein